MMDLTGLHILLTYRCNYECDHCFVWGSPWQTGTFTLTQLTEVFRQARLVSSIEEIYFEGGEAFLYHPILVEAVGRAKQLGFRTGIVSNGYWATAVEDAWFWLRPLVAAGLDSLDVSFDQYHREPSAVDASNGKTHPADAAAGELFLKCGTIALEPPGKARDPETASPGAPLVGGDVMFRGRAAEKLVAGLPRQPWAGFDHCPYEELRNPSRLHLDPLGFLHVCQGITIGNLFDSPLPEIIAGYDPDAHPIVGRILKGGPADLARSYDVEHEAAYVDACHLCYTTRQALRSRFPVELGPDHMYGVMSG